MRLKTIQLILNREYYTRVTSKSFIWGTILTPIGMGILFFVSGMLMTHSGNKEFHIIVKDNNNVLPSYLKDDKIFHFSFQNAPIDTLKKSVIAKQFDGLLVIPTLDSIEAREIKALYYSAQQLGIEHSLVLDRKISNSFRQNKIKVLNIDASSLQKLETKTSINPEPLDKNGKNHTSLSNKIAAAIGGIMGYIMFMVVFIYGMMIMRSVMEEKTSRIVEVIISSVKPIELMIGKILGVGAVGLTQLLFWVIAVPIISLIVNMLMGVDLSSNTLSSDLMNESLNQVQKGQIANIFNEVLSLNWWLILPMFIFYFLGGFFIYASLYAAVGSAIGDDVGESQSISFPISLPIIISLYMMVSVVKDPNTNLAVWASIFPLTSPIIMPARLAFDPPIWQILLSAVSLILGVLFFAWVAAKIYRVGILMYGKRMTAKELARWMFK